MSEPMVIFSRTFLLLDWLLPKAAKFPKTHRFTISQRLMSHALDLAEHLNRAQACRAKARLAALKEADLALEHLCLYLRLIHQWQWLSHGQYQHVSEIIAEIGRLLGGWLKQTEKTSRAARDQTTPIRGQP